MRLDDRLADLLVDLHGRRGRAFLLLAAVGLSTGAMLASIGLSQTASSQVSNEIAASITDELTVSANGTRETPLFEPDAVTRVEALAMVDGVGLRMDVDDGIAPVSRAGHVPRRDQARVIGVSAGYLGILGPAPSAAWLLDGDSNVAVLGAGAAEALGVPAGHDWTGYAIDLAGASFSIVGVLDASAPEDDSAVFIPYERAAALLGTDGTARLVVHTAPGAGARVADVVRTAIDPTAPTAYTVTRVADLKDVRRGVDSHLASLVGAIAVILLLLTILLVTNAMVANVIGRTAEIGLRRALGASTPDILMLVLAEGAFIGTLGGFGGSALGTWSTVAVSALSGWAPVLHPVTLLLGPLIGLLIGLLAGIHPAAKAARIDPALAVRME